MELDQEYLSTRKATDTWQAAQLQAISAGTEGAGTLAQPKAELTIDANTAPGNDATMNDGKRVTDLKLAKPPTADTPAEVVTDQPISYIEGKTPEGRPILKNPDGSISTERSITITDERVNGGKPTNIPSMFGGTQLTEEAAIQRIVEAGGKDPETGKPVQSFNTIEEAVKAAEQRSQELGKQNQQQGRFTVTDPRINSGQPTPFDSLKDAQAAAGTPDPLAKIEETVGVSPLAGVLQTAEQKDAAKNFVDLLNIPVEHLAGFITKGDVKQTATPDELGGQILAPVIGKLGEMLDEKQLGLLTTAVGILGMAVIDPLNPALAAGQAAKAAKQTIFRAGGKGNYYSTSKEYAQEFGDKVKELQISESDILDLSKPEHRELVNQKYGVGTADSLTAQSPDGKLPSANDAGALDRLDTISKELGFKASKQSEGKGQPDSIYLYVSPKNLTGGEIKTAAEAKAALTKKPLKDAVEILKSERGSFQPIPGGEDAAKAAPKAEPPQVPAVSPFAENFKKNAEDFGFRVDGFLDELTKQRRGPVLSDVKVGELAAQSDLTMAGLLELPPGTILNPEHTVKAKQLFKAGAKRMREAAQAVKDSGGDPATISEMFRSIGEMGIATTKMAGLYAESGRTTRLLNQKYPIQEAAEAVKRDPEFRIADAMIQQLYEFFAKAQAATGVNPGGMTVEKVADMVLSMKTEEEMAVFAKAISKPGWWDMFTEVWINGLLSGPVTHTTNLLSNAATLLWNIPERAIASGLSRGAIRPGEAQAMLGGITESMGDAWALAWKAFKEEESQLGVGKIETPRKAITADALELTGVPGRAVDFLGNAIRLPGRFLLAGDDFFKSIAFRAELRALAKREAFKAINEGGLTGAEAATKAKDIEARILANPPESIKDAAQEFASYVTFTRELGETGQKVQALASTPVGRLVLPFVRTPTNIFKFAGERTPFALASRAVRDEIMAGGERQALALAKISLGSMTMGSMAMLAANGYVTGNGPKDPALREIKKATGWQPNSFKIGDEYVSYSRLEPIGSLFGMAADAADLMGQLDQMDAEELAAALTVAFARNASSKTFIKGLAETLHAVTSQDVKIVNNYLEKELPTLIPFSSLVKTVRNIDDPVMREVDTILDAFRNKVPGFSTDLPPHRNLWGDPILMEGALGPDFLSPLYTSSVKDDPVSTEIDRLQLPIRKPARSIDGIPLTPQEYDAYVVLSGGKPTIHGLTLKQKLADLMASPLYARSSDGPDGGKATLVRQIVSDYRDRAKQILTRPDLSQEYLGATFPDLIESLGAARQQERQKFNTPMTAPGGLTR